MKMLKWILRILVAPMMIALKLIVLVLSFALSVSSSLLSVISGLIGLFAVISFFAVSKENGFWLLIIAWLISPSGIPMLAEWLLNRLEGLRQGTKRIIYQ